MLDAERVFPCEIIREVHAKSQIVYHHTYHLNASTNEFEIVIVASSSLCYSWSAGWGTSVIVGDV